MENARIHVSVVDHVRQTKTNVTVPNDVPANRLIPALVRALNLPLDQNGQPIVYHLDVMRGQGENERVGEQMTLEQAGVGDGTIISLFPEVTAGGHLPPEARMMRLANDYEVVLEMHKKDGLFRILNMSGEPPRMYRLLYTCQGIERIGSDGQPVYRDEHIVDVELGATYPAERPFLRWRTPIFQPNILPNGQEVCIGKWRPSMSLGDLCLMLGQMIQYQNYAAYDALNAEASMWAMKKENRDYLPVDDRLLLNPERRIPHSIPGAASDTFEDIEISILGHD